ncbi:MAG: purine phosphorylase [Gammaproteobacteria bacterium]
MSFTGVVVAMRMEARSLGGRGTAVTDRVEAGGRMRIQLAGIGPRRAEAAAQALVEGGARALVSWGIAVALDPDLARGALLLPETVIDSGAHFATDSSWRNILRARLKTLHPCPAALLQTQRILDTPEAKSRARSLSGAAAADMESGPVGRVAAAAGLPFVAIRAVADRASDKLPIVLDAEYRWRAGTLLRDIARHPAHIAALVSAGIGFGAAHRTLTRVAARLDAGLGAPVR